MYLQGWLQVDIADELGLDQSTISRDLQHLHKEWQQSALIDFDEAKAQELAKVDRLEREYWVAWKHSQKDTETMRQEGTKKGDSIEPEKLIKIAKGQVGDPRFLNGVQWCINKRCEILGLDAMAQSQITWREEVIRLLNTGKITAEQVIDEVGSELATELFNAAGIAVTAIGEAEEEG